MKELSIEEKAKAYDKALAIARDLYNSKEYAKSHTEIKATYEAIFPELAESKDEKMRKELIRAFKSLNTLEVWNGIKRIDILDWLEKKCEHKSLDNIAKEITKDKDAAISFLKSAGIINENGELADEYKIEQAEQKPTEWSEEDKTMLQYAIEHFEHQKRNSIGDGGRRKVLQEFIDWLKSLKDRVQPQPKQEWSEEDEEMIDSIIGNIKYLYSIGSCDNATVDMKVNWLKSLSPQSQWKPSEGQIKVCKEVFADILSAKGFDLGTVNSELNRLEEELKKLRE